MREELIRKMLDEAVDAYIIARTQLTSAKLEMDKQRENVELVIKNYKKVLFE